MVFDGCCSIGNEFHVNENSFASTDNFFATPALGQMGKRGYVLLCSKEHIIGGGRLPADWLPELYHFKDSLINRLSEMFQTDMIVLEHGPKVMLPDETQSYAPDAVSNLYQNNPVDQEGKIPLRHGGGCQDHFHLHLIPVSRDPINYMIGELSSRIEPGQTFQCSRISDYSPMADICAENRDSYMLLEDPGNRSMLVTVNFALRSMHGRYVLGQFEQNPEWNWHDHPQTDLFNESLNFLQANYHC